VSPAILPDEVRASAAVIAARATAVRIDRERMDALTWPGDAPAPALDPARHYLEGTEADVAAYLLTVDAVNFGSGWFPTLAKRRGTDGRLVSGYFTIAWALADRFRAHGPWTNAQLRAMRTEEIAARLGQRADHELMARYAQALRSLGCFLGERTTLDLVREAGRSAAALARTVAGGMALWADRGFYKRAQLLASDLALAGVAAFDDLGRLTIFADNLVPHVLRCDGVLVYDPLLAAHVDRGRLLVTGPWEREIRGCAVHACATLAPRLGLTEQALDHILSNRGQAPEYKERPRHRCRSVYH
jgi:hypothetical protein